MRSTLSTFTQTMGRVPVLTSRLFPNRQSSSGKTRTRTVSPRRSPAPTPTAAPAIGLQRIGLSAETNAGPPVIVSQVQSVLGY
jgi:hypothetical protein